MNSQQDQTRKFFEQFARQWSKNAKSDYGDFVNIVKIRNQFVIDTCTRFLKNNSKTLDVGCGTGDLVISLLNLNYDSMGIDFSSSMIEEAKRDAEKKKLDPGKFIHVSFFDYKSKTKFDLISANGFIEYISEKEFDVFLDRSTNFLNENGILAFESRNRLFNCFSFNSYTEAEMDIGEINNLLEECVIFNKATDKQDIISNSYTPKLKRNLNKHELTKTKYANITVDVRYQYTPFQLIKKLEERNYEVLNLQPIHIHAMTTGAKEKHPEIHKNLSYYLLEQKDLHMQLIPQSSSFMISARKK